MSKHEEAERARFVELSVRGYFPAIYCPACGRNVVANEGPCDHVLVLSHDSAGFDYVHPKLKDIARAIEEGGDTLFDFAERIASDRVFFLAITTQGYGCGPFSITQLAGFEFPATQAVDH